MISGTEKELNEKRDEAEAVFKRWYSNAVELSSDLVITVTLHKVQQSTNTQILISGYILNCFTFGNTQKTSVQLLGLVPSITMSHTDANIDAVSEMYSSYLPNPQTLDVEYHRWTRKWHSERTQPDALQHALEACDADIFPNIHCLLRIACTIPVTSSDNEHLKAGMFTNVVARWPGRTHDSQVFRTSDISTYLQNNHRSLDDGVLLGDSGYACSPFLMTPYTVTRNAAQEAYNDAHAKTRVVIEQTFGRWKRRFHVLHAEIRMGPEKVCVIVGAYAVLHNIAVRLHEPMEDEEVDELADVDPYHGPQQGLSLRDHICQTFFG
ncbi:uncharacterized protein [Montipora foliosa]|uniref:uncharacterized protein n=1 Tax=Montipora foliosa TaxID=591990 RepID=UPI0035F16A7D